MQGPIPFVAIVLLVLFIGFPVAWLLVTGFVYIGHAAG